MRLVRFGARGTERPGLLDAQGRVRDLSAHVPDLGPAALAPEVLARLSALNPESLPVADAGRLGCPVAGVGKIVGVGLNYRDHAEECGAAIPQTPILFFKATTSLSGPDDDVVLPPGSTATDWEVELAVVIGSRARRVAAGNALRHVAGYCIGHDVSERMHQLELGTQWTKGKSHDTFCPLGPWLVTADEVPDPQRLALWCEVNGARVQDSGTHHMIFDVAACIADASRYMTLEPGDVILTGTPAGVGLGRTPRVYLKAGDVVRLGIQGLGTQTQRVVAGVAGDAGRGAA